MNVLSFRLFLWYSSGVFALIIVILISVYAVVFDGVSSLIAALFSSDITLLILYGGDNNYNGLLVVLNIKPGVYSLGDYGPNACSLPT